MNKMEMTFGKKKNGSARLLKEAELSDLQRPRGRRKGRSASRTRDFLRVLSLGLSSHPPVLRRLHD